MKQKGTYKKIRTCPDKEKVGCMVPFCTAEFCDRKRKSFCALRKYFLIQQKALRQAISGIDEFKHYVYYWRKHARKEKPVNQSQDREVS